MNNKTIQELREWESGIKAVLDYWDGKPIKERYCILTPEDMEKFSAILTRSEQEAKDEPLAVLAARKGCYIRRAIRLPDRWVINLDAAQTTPMNNSQFDGLMSPYLAPTYEEAESKARAYLAGLPDKGDNK